MNSNANGPAELVVHDLGRMDYADTLTVQRDTHQRVLDSKAPQVLLLVEHNPVITISKRKGASDHLRASRSELARIGIDVQATDRGGDITYHGPGQLVAYPILRLAPLHLNVGRYMRLLEQIVIDTVAAFGVNAVRDSCATGVWAHPPNTSTGPRTSNPRPKKLCALGIRVRRNVTMHGMAINVTTDLDHFQTIVPCGLAGRAVTSLHEMLGEQCPVMGTVKTELATQVGRHLAMLADAPTMAMPA